MALSLDASKGDLADLLRVKTLPCLIVHVLEEGHDVDWVDEVDESVANVAAVVEVEWQVEEVVMALVKSVNTRQEHLFSVLVGDVADHDCCASILTLQYAVQIDFELGVIVLLFLLLFIGSHLIETLVVTHLIIRSHLEALRKLFMLLGGSLHG